MLPRLAALRITPFVSLAEDVLDADVDFRLVEQVNELSLKSEMQELADKIFKNLQMACSKLRAVVIDPRCEDEDFDGVARRCGYVRGTLTKLYGDAIATAVPMEPHMIKHDVPELDGSDTERWMVMR